MQDRSPVPLRTRAPRLAAALRAAVLLLGACGVAACSCVDHPHDVRCLISDNCAPAPPYEHCPPPGCAPVPPTFAQVAPSEAPPPLPDGVADRYRIGIGDVLNVSVPGQEKFLGLGETTKGNLVGVRVKEDGKVYLPLVQGVPAAGRTALELQEDLRERLKTFITDPFVSVDVLEYRSQRLYVLGEVAKPGVQPVTGEVRLLDAISSAGGLKNGDADVEGAYVVRQGRVLPLNFGDALRTASPADNVLMRNGDVVFVPDTHDQRVYVLGEVRSPGIVPIRKGRLSLVEAIAASGGIDPATAARDQVRIFRGGWSRPHAYTLSAHEVTRFGNDILLKPGDRVFVAPSGLATWGRAFTQVSPLVSTALTGAAAVEIFKD